MYVPGVRTPMCRLFGLLSSRVESAEPWLVKHERSLLAQSNVTPEVAQRDGWGVGWFTSTGRTVVVKGVHGAFEEGEVERFRDAAKAAEGPLVIGHLRHASNPMNLPRERLLALENSQPFENHTTLFAHNGSIPFPTETRPLLGVHEPKVRGVNDSEVLFWLLVRHAEENHDPLNAYVHAVEDLVRVWMGLGRPAIPPYSGLNVLFAPSPDDLWAFCLWTGDHGTGLFDDSRRYYEMAYHAEPHRVVVGSEPFDLTAGTWKSLESGTYLHARRVGEHVECTTGAIPLPSALEIRPLPA